MGERERDVAGPTISVFRDDEGGYASVAVALALLVSFALVFSLAAAAWTLARSADIQTAADAAALSATQAVGTYSTAVQILDAIVQTLGIGGMLLVGAGMVAIAVPGGRAAGKTSVEAGIRMLESRRKLVKSAVEGMGRIEKALPLVAFARARQTLEAQEHGEIRYQGVVLAYPLTSHSDFSGLDAEVDTEGIEEATERLGEASDAAAQARREAETSKEEAWRADCAERPYCLRERAGALAGLTESLNPDYASPDSWTFGAPLLRSRAYYAARLAQEAPAASDAEEETRSAIRHAFYRYAEGECRRGFYEESADGRVALDLPSLPHNAEETRATTLFADALWPTTQEEGSRTLHAYAGCPGARGSAGGAASLADLEGGSVMRCDVCGMDLKAMGRVASATTNTESGFEHWWRIIEQASKRYRKAVEDGREADARTKETAQENADRFDEALDVLEGAHVEFCPPGAWGCVAAVTREGGASVPLSQKGSFLRPASLPAGAAISAAVLAPDASDGAGTVLSATVDEWERLLGEKDSLTGSVVDVWEKLLGAYASGYRAAEHAADDLLDQMPGTLGGGAAAWLREAVRSGMQEAGLAPQDLRPRRPVLTSTRHVFGQAGLSAAAEREHLATLLDAGAGAPERFAAALGLGSGLLPEDGIFRLAEFVLPGRERGVALTLAMGRGL